MSSIVPQYLYRYRHLQGNHRKYTSKILTDSALYFASPTSFNDPFDCKIHYQPSIHSRELRQAFMEWTKKLNPELNRADRRSEVNQYLKLNRETLLEGITRLLQNDVNKLGVLSLSLSYSNVLLWSHYAASHSGICLKFLGTDSTPFFGRAQRVEYSPEYPKADLLRDTKEHHIKSFLLTKAIAWNYEEEWRIINTKGSGESFFPANLLVGVILGALMPYDDKEYVVNLLKRRKYSVEIYEASINKGSYSLDFKPYETQ
jgi:Protein of unknown function (DUF2971)